MSENTPCDNKVLKDPTNLDLHTAQVKQETILKTLCQDIGEIKSVLVGEDKRGGLVVDVDRLKNSRAMLYSIVGIIFTAIVGTTTTVIASMFRSH